MVPIAIVSLVLNFWFQHTASQSQATEDHVNVLIEKKLTPAVKGIADQLSGLTEKIGKLEGRFDQLDSEQKKATKLQLNKLSAQIAILQKTKTKIDQQTVAQLGEGVLGFVSSSDAKVSELAWDTATRLANYRTTLNQAAAPRINIAKLAVPKPYLHITVVSRILAPGPPGTGPVVGVDETKSVPFSDTARYEKIGEPNQSQQPGPEYIVVTGKSVEILLDGYRLKNVVIHDVQVLYGGGPLIMENVYFVNCTFHFPPKPLPNADQLTAAILNSPSISFSTEKAGD
jgi:hypothetical protein